jgi:TPR repeat protein
LGNNIIGFFYEFGRGGLPKDDNAAARHYELAAEAGEAWGQYNLARFNETGRGGLTADDREAARLYKQAADQRFAPAEVVSGSFTREGVAAYQRMTSKLFASINTLRSKAIPSARIILAVSIRTVVAGCPRAMRKPPDYTVSPPTRAMR